MKSPFHLLSVIGASLCLSIGTASADPQLLFEDTFTAVDPAWCMDTHSQLKNGAFTITVAVPNMCLHYAYQSDVFSDADISVTLSNSTADPASCAGLVFWAQDANNYYVALLYPNGQYSLSRLVANRWIYPIAITASPAIAAGANTKNVLRVVTSGIQITMYINGKQVAATKGQPPAGGGQMGLYAQSGAAAATISAQDYKVMSLQ